MIQIKLKNNQNFVSVIKKEKHFKNITNSDIIHLIKYFKLNSFDDNNDIEEFIPIYHLKQNINFNFDKFQWPEDGCKDSALEFIENKLDSIGYNLKSNGLRLEQVYDWTCSSKY